MIGCVGELGHFGLKEVPPKSTITDGNRQRDNKFFESLLVKKMGCSHCSSEILNFQNSSLINADYEF